jgi:DNA ligase-1
MDSLLAYQDNCIRSGFEGWCGRRPNAIYKEGRSTFNQHYLLKGKLFEDAEATIVGYRELQHNDNPQQLDQLGYLKRPSNKENQRPGGMLGAFKCLDCKTNLEFWLGGGFTIAQRQEFWAQRDHMISRVCTYRHQPYGAKDRPRILTFVGVRYDL